MKKIYIILLKIFLIIVFVNQKVLSDEKIKVGLIVPSASQIYNVFDIMYDVGGNKYNHYTARNVRRLIPFQNVWFLDSAFDKVEKGLR